MEKTITFLIIGLLVGAGAGIGVGYVAFNSSEGDQMYWFYMDFSEVVGDAPDNQWISAKSDNPVTAFHNALKGANLWDDTGTGSVGADGWINNIAGISGDWNEEGTQWMSWFWSISDMRGSAQAWRENPGFDVTTGTVFYVGFTEATYDADAFGNFILMNKLNPNDGVVWNLDYSEILSLPEWAEGGPFAA